MAPKWTVFGGLTDIDHLTYMITAAGVLGAGLQDIPLSARVAILRRRALVGGGFGASESDRNRPFPQPFVFLGLLLDLPGMGRVRRSADCARP